MNSTTISPVNFQAQIKPNFKIEDGLFQNIQERFSILTQNKPNVTLYLSKLHVQNDNEENLLMHLSQKKSMQLSDKEIYYEGPNIVISAWDKLKSHLSESEIAEYLEKRFNVMCLEDKYLKAKEELLTQIDYIHKKFSENKEKAKSLKEKGLEKLSKAFGVIAIKNKSKLNSLNFELNEITKAYKTNLKKIAKGDEELMQLGNIE